MLILLPPSETKRDGGTEGSALDLAALRFEALHPVRADAVAAVGALCADPEAALRALKLSPRQSGEVARNRMLLSSPVMPAIDRYTGVLFDALDAASLSVDERAFAARHVLIHSALFGPIGALDPIPAYRLSHDSRLPGMPLRRHWREAASSALQPAEGLVLDLRSEAYAELGDAPEHALFLRVVSEDDAGRRRALNHFNKKGKGEFARALIAAGVDHPDAESLLRWAEHAGIRLQRGAPGELDLIV